MNYAHLVLLDFSRKRFLWSAVWFLCGALHAVSAPAADAAGLAITDGAPLGTQHLAVRLPDSARLLYAVQGQASHFNYSASAELLWQHGAGEYRLQQTMKMPLLGTRTQTSTGRVGVQALEPQRFDDSRKRRSVQLDFAQALARFSTATPPVPIAPGTQDRLSVFLQLAALLRAAPHHYPLGTHIHLAVVGTQRAERWTFVVADSQRLDLPAGSMQALRLDRVRHDNPQQASLWLAPALQYLPVRIRLVQGNGDSADMQLKASSFSSKQ